MNQIQPAPYQQPSFSHALGSYPQQPHFGPASSSSTSSASSPAVTAPQYSHIQSPSPSLPQSQSRSQSHPQLQHPLSVTYSQSPSASPSTQAFPSHANPISPSLASPIQQYQQQQQQQQQRYQHQLPQLQTQHHQTQLSAGNGGYPGTGVRNGATQASRSEQGSHTGEITPARSATFSPPAAATPTLSPGFSTQQQGSQKYPMAAPPLPQSAQRQQSPHGGSNPATSQPASPRTAASSALEKERVALLLEVNLLLLEELNNLLSQGKGGAVDAQQVALLRQQGMPEKRAADEYIQTFYRLKANLAYLYSQPDMQALNPQKQNQAQPANKGPAHPPAFMHPPPHMPGLESKYEALRKLFPGWVGKDAEIGSGGGNTAPGP